MRTLDSYEQAAVHLLDSPLLAPKLAELRTDPKWDASNSALDIDWTLAKRASRGWSSGERFVFELAAHLFNDVNRGPQISDLVNTLDDENWLRCMEALAIRRLGR